MRPGRFALSAEWRDAADRMGFEGVPLHALRHTHASQLIHAGVDVVTVSKRLGHASPAITLKIYAHLFSKDDGKAAQRSAAPGSSRLTLRMQRDCAAHVRLIVDFRKGGRVV